MTQGKINIKEIRRLVRNELIREMQEAPIDLAYVGDVEELPEDMVEDADEMTKFAIMAKR